METGPIIPELPDSKRERALAYGLSIGTGVLAGAVAAAYRYTVEMIEGGRGRLADIVRERPLLALPWILLAASAALAVAFLIRRFPLIKGSGIPQVRAMLTRRVASRWILELPSKFSGGILALGAGLSLGREGPSIQLGALAGKGLSSLFKRDRAEPYLLTAGAAAGIAAAFNAPLAGVLFCVEELHRAFSPSMLACAMLSSLSAAAVSWIAFGRAHVFPFADAVPPSIALYPAVALLGLICGILGAAFNKALLGTQRIASRLLPSPRWRLVSAFLIASAAACAFPIVSGGGHGLIAGVAEGSFGILMLCAAFAAKFALTSLSYASGAPGGIFLPMLALGAAAGGAVARCLEGFGIADYQGATFAILGMAAFFTAVVRAPITGTVLVMELAGTFEHLPALILACATAGLSAAVLRAKPIYDELYDGLIRSGDGAPSAPLPDEPSSE